MESQNRPFAERLDNGSAATYLGKSASWLNKERAEGRGPRFVRIGARVLYRLRDLDQYIESRAVETTDTRRGAA